MRPLSQTLERLQKDRSFSQLRTSRPKHAMRSSMNMATTTEAVTSRSLLFSFPFHQRSVRFLHDLIKKRNA